MTINNRYDGEEWVELNQKIEDPETRVDSCLVAASGCSLVIVSLGLAGFLVIAALKWATS